MLETGLGGEDTAYASEVAARHRRPTVSTPRIEILTATGAVATELQLDDGSATVVSRQQRRYIDDTPWSLQITFYPMALVEQGAVRLIQAEDMPSGTVRYLEETLGIKQAGCHDKITVRAPTANETTFFKLPDDGRVAVFEIFQTGFDEQGQPIRLTVSVYPTDRNQFAVDIGRVPDLAVVPAFGW